MGWMNDTLRFTWPGPVHRHWHHDKMTFRTHLRLRREPMLPISHDEGGAAELHGTRCRATSGRSFTNHRAYYGFMWGHPN